MTWTPTQLTHFECGGAWTYWQDDTHTGHATCDRCHHDQTPVTWPAISATMITEHIDHDLTRADAPIKLTHHGDLTGYGEIVRNAITTATQPPTPLPCEDCGTTTTAGIVDDDGDFHCATCEATYQAEQDHT